MSSAASSGNARPLIALVAGEASGDQLGAALIGALGTLVPGAGFVGVGGPRMQAAGMDCWWNSDELALMGIFEVLGHLPRLIRLRRELRDRLVAARPDILVGIDSPDFNLGLERRVRAAGIRAVHYVSPTVWAWRQGRVKTIAASTDMVLCLFPFEPDFYREHGVDAAYTGHPLADGIDEQTTPYEARRQLGLPREGLVFGLLPGSRRSEAEHLSEPLLGAARLLLERYPGARFAAPMASPAVRRIFEAALARSPGMPCTVVNGQARQAMAASDVVICASGTATLEAMLINRPMVVVYRFNPVTYYLGRALRLYKADHFALPNILAGEALVPELVQRQVTPRRLADEVTAWLDQPERRGRVQRRFRGLHEELRRDAARSAAECIRELLERR
jgi:lipid-A-disaccharide synthase